MFQAAPETRTRWAYFETSKEVQLELSEPEWSYVVARVGGSSVTLCRPSRDCCLFPMVTGRLLRMLGRSVKYSLKE